MELSFSTHPDRYRHWQLKQDGRVVELTMNVSPREGLSSNYELKLNSYDLSVDIELADAIMRIRFERPEVQVVVVKSALERVFCAGANIPMLAQSSHHEKVNFCKFTNETRLYIEDASRHSQMRFVAALRGTCAGGGYELACACDEIVLIDDGNSAVSLPEVSLLGVLPGTGGLTRLVDKRNVRPDLADVFCTLSEGVRGQRAVDWGLVDAAPSRSQFDSTLARRIAALADTVDDAAKGPGIVLDDITPQFDGTNYTYRHVRAAADAHQRTVAITIYGPQSEVPTSAEALQAAGASSWSLRCFRELDDLLLRIRHNHPTLGLLIIRSEGNIENVLAADRTLWNHREHWLANEITSLMARVLRRLEVTARSVFTLVERGSCFAGCLLELALASDRTYMLQEDALPDETPSSEERPVRIALSSLNAGALPTASGLSRIARRLGTSAAEAVLERARTEAPPLGTEEAEALGLVTLCPDELDWDDEIRIAIEERASLSPDALSGMEASLRFAGPETLESKIFARLSAWQNWIFQRENAIGPHGALTSYGGTARAEFDWHRC